LALIPERLWVILDRKSDVACREMGPKSYRPQPDRRPAITALAAVMLLFRGTEISDDREFTVYKKGTVQPVGSAKPMETPL
jgi:hypothetical protein